MISASASPCARIRTRDLGIDDQALLFGLGESFDTLRSTSAG